MQQDTSFPTVQEIARQLIDTTNYPRYIIGEMFKQLDKDTKKLVLEAIKLQNPKAFFKILKQIAGLNKRSQIAV